MSDEKWHLGGLCGPSGLVIWSADRHDFGRCFQALCFHIPLLCLLAIVSSYHCGRTNIRAVAQTRGITLSGRLHYSRWRTTAINVRCVCALLMALLPVIHIYVALSQKDSSATDIRIISYFLGAVRAITWFTHLWYTIGLRGWPPHASVAISVLWSGIFVVSILTLRSEYVNYYYSTGQMNPAAYLMYIFSLVNVLLLCVYLLTMVPRRDSRFSTDNLYTEINNTNETQPLLLDNSSDVFRFTNRENDPNYLGVAMEEAGCMSKMLFYWVNPLMEKGVLHESKLRVADDLFDLPFALDSDVLWARLDKALIGDVDSRAVRRRQSQMLAETGNSSRHNVTLLWALHRCFWRPFYSVGILRFLADCSAFAAPILLNKLISFIEAGNSEQHYENGYLYAAGLLTVTLISSLCDVHFNFQMSMLGLKMRAALVTTIYRKTMSLPKSQLSAAFSVGEIVNFMSTDTDRIVNSCPSFHAVWSIPFQLFISLYLLYQQVGVAFLAGVGFSVLLIPVNKIIANRIGVLSERMMTAKDKRIKMLSEILRGIKAIKLYVWEDHFIRVLFRLRDNELKYLKSRKYLDALCVYFWATTPILISICTFGTFVLLGNSLNAAIVFTGVALVNMLISPLNAFPWVLNGLIEAWVSLRRIQRLMNLESLDVDNLYTPCDSNEQNHIVIHEASFNWDETSPNSDHFSLKCINMSVKKGEFVGITGPVGSGKSSLLSAILGELRLQHGEILSSGVHHFESGFGYVSQQPWLQRGTVRRNILFGGNFDDDRYRTVLFACGLAEDVLLWPDGDLTFVGDGGMTLSGGQKARIALARAVYQDKCIYLLDDVLAAVDVNVAKHIFRHCIMGLLHDKTRILCTHHIQYLAFTDRMIVLNAGRIQEHGKPSDLIENSSLLMLEDDDDDYDGNAESMDTVDTMEDTSRDVAFMKCDLSGDFEEKQIVKDENETSEVGSVDVKVYLAYWKAIGHWLCFGILIAIVMMQLTRNVSDLWLAQWVSTTSVTPKNTTDNHSTIFRTDVFHWFTVPSTAGYYLEVYTVFVVVNSVFTLFRAFLFAYGGIVAATKIHRLLIKAVLKAKFALFIVPLGQILNRFSSDTYTIDDSLPFILNILLAQFFGLLGTVLITVYGLPWICLVLIPLIPVYHWLQYRYRLTSRELKRISSVTLSPIYSHFSESIQGLVTIRALRTVPRFHSQNETAIEANLRAQFASVAAARWLALRLQLIGVAMVAGVAFIAAIQHQCDQIDAGLVGLALSYCLSVTGALSGVVNAFTETEREMIAVERVDQYVSDIVPEAATHLVAIDPPFGWPNMGVVEFDRVVFKYRSHLRPSLKGVTFRTRPCEKVGIVGRTGAGKTTLFNALFRLGDLQAGTITIDFVDVVNISLAALRARLFCIPQEPFIISGSLRDNLDPLAEFREHELWSAIDKVNLTEFVQKRLGGLDAILTNGEHQLSLGQKQLLCLARAVLHNSKVLCIDEATANVDMKTDRQIQRTLKTAFRNSTVLTIAHRTETILDSDRVLVIDDGKVVEFDTPDELLANSNSYFYQLIHQKL